MADEIRAVILGGLGRVFDEGLRQGEAELAGARRALEEAVAQNVLLQAERQHLHTRLEGMGVELAAAEADRDAVLAELYDADPTARGRWRTRLDTKRQSLRELDELIRASEKPPKGPT